MKLKPLRKALLTETYLRGLIKSVGGGDDNKLAYFKKMILETLDSDDSEHSDMQKAGYPVGTIREWKGKKFIKVAPNKWRPKYDSHDRGAKMAISAIKRKVDQAKTAKELMDIVMENRERFSDTEGRPLPFVQELSDYVSGRNDTLDNQYKAKQAKVEARKQKKAEAEKNKREQYSLPAEMEKYHLSEKTIEAFVTMIDSKDWTHNEILHKLSSSYHITGKDARLFIKWAGKTITDKRNTEHYVARMKYNEQEVKEKKEPRTAKIKQKVKTQISKLQNKHGRDQRMSDVTRRKPKQEAENPTESPPIGSDDSQDSEDFNAIREKYQSGKSTEGNDDEIYIGDEALEGHWKLVEADAPSASHDENDFHKTRGFPKNRDGSTINDRDYANDRAAQETVITMSCNFDGRALSFDSPVVVTQDGIVISGNNRTMSSKLAARRGNDTRYIDALKKRASRFGFSPDNISKFKHPRVVFEIEKSGDYSTAEFAKYNQETQKTMSPIEQAVKVSKIIKEETVKDIANKISEFDTMGELYANHKACADIYNLLGNAGIINQFNRNSYIDLDGVITGAGKEFLETALLGSTVNEQNIRGLNREGCKSIRAKLVRAITPLINNKAMGGYSIIDELNQAIDLCMQFNIAKDKFGSLSDFAEQGRFFEDISKVALELAHKMQMNQKDFAHFMLQMNASLEVGASGQADVFIGEIESKDDILKRMLDLKKAIANVIANTKAGVYGARFENIRTASEVKKAVATSTIEGNDVVIFDVALDFDGVINSYKSGWQGADKTDEPVEGAADGLNNLLDEGLKVVIYSTRAETAEGQQTIKDYLHNLIGDRADGIEVSSGKPIATVYVDDRAVTFTGDWEAMPERIGKFKSWLDKSLTFSGHKLQGRTKLHGMDVSIENKKGSIRSGTDKNGHEWSQKMGYDYGYIRGTVGKDKDHVDCFIGPNPESEKVFIIHQVDPYTDGKLFDEDKVMLGWDDVVEAKKAYISQYDRPDFFGSMNVMEIDEFKKKAFKKENQGKMLK
jgi:hypothetical protein